MQCKYFEWVDRVNVYRGENLKRLRSESIQFEAGSLCPLMHISATTSVSAPLCTSINNVIRFKPVPGDISIPL